MSKVRIHCISLSLDGYMAGPDQNLDHPLGVGGQRIHEWIFATKAGREMIGRPGGDEGVDNDFLRRGFEGVGATVMGRNMFGPMRGPWRDEWNGWWGDDPPFHHPVFVLTHQPRDPLAMSGGTTFHFVTDGIESALDRAKGAAAGADVRIGGGASVIQQYLKARLVDEMHVAVVPVLLGRGERLFENLGPWPDGYACEGPVVSGSVAHFQVVRATPETS